MTATPWAFPIVEQGDVVLFARDLSDRKQTPAIVMAVYHNCLDVLLVGNSTAGRNQVRHRDDPFIKDRPDLIEDSGVFVLSPPTLRLRALEQTVAELAVEVARIKRVPLSDMQAAVNKR